MIDKQSRMKMRAIGSDRSRAVVNDCGWKGGTSSRKALLIIVGEPSSGRLLTINDLRNATSCGLPATAVAGNSSSTIDIAKVIASYDTDKELPVLFVDEKDDEEILSIFLYDMPVAVA